MGGRSLERKKLHVLAATRQLEKQICLMIVARQIDCFTGLLLSTPHGVERREETVQAATRISDG
jgi:hypothetical protein